MDMPLGGYRLFDSYLTFIFISWGDEELHPKDTPMYFKSAMGMGGLERNRFIVDNM